jgi:hypothetical protein
MNEPKSTTTANGPHRYRMIYTADRTLLVRDDGRRIDFMVVWPDDHGDIGQWRSWAGYDTGGLPSVVADALFAQQRL